MKRILACGILGVIVACAAIPANAAGPSTSSASTKSGASAVSDVVAAGTIVMPGAFAGMGGAAGGAAASAASSGLGLSQPQLIMNSTNAPSTSTFNDCGIAWSGAAWVISFSKTSESEDCKSQRQAIFAAVHLKSIPIAFESMCAIESFRMAVARTNEPQCAQTLADRAKNAPRPVAVAPAPQPVQTVAAFDPCGGRGVARQNTMPDGSVQITCQ
jgi:hypothetical protein